MKEYDWEDTKPLTKVVCDKMRCDKNKYGICTSDRIMLELYEFNELIAGCVCSSERGDDE